MASGITFWGRTGHEETKDAQMFLRAHKYGADAVRDIDRDPPRGADWEHLRKGIGGALTALIDPRHPEFAAAPADAELGAWFEANPRRLRAPILLTPRGAIAGFGERRWIQFLDIGKGR